MCIFDKSEIVVGTIFIIVIFSPKKKLSTDKWAYSIVPIVIHGHLDLIPMNYYIIRRCKKLYFCKDRAYNKFHNMYDVRDIQKGVPNLEGWNITLITECVIKNENFCFLYNLYNLIFLTKKESEEYNKDFPKSLWF